MIPRPLARDEIDRFWTLDRREIIHNIYMLQDGELVLKPDYFDVRGWPPGEAERYTPLLTSCFDRGGAFYGMFEDERLIGAVVLDSVWFGKNRDLLQLKMLHVSCDYRGRGVGTRLFQLACDIARQRGARGLYISATPSENTIHFYQRHGAIVTPDPDPDLLELEPEDIHLECDAYAKATISPG